MRLGDGTYCPTPRLDGRRPTHRTVWGFSGCDERAQVDLNSSAFPRSGCALVQGIKMSSSGSQNQRKERFLKVLASQGKSPSLVQSRRRTSKYSHKPESNQTNVQTFDGLGSYASTFSPSTQVRFNPSSRDVSSSVSALKAGLGRISSTPIFRNLFSSYSFPVRTADEPPPLGQSDSLTDDFCSSSDALILPETPMMDTGGSFGVHQWGLLDTNLLDVFTTGAEASPGL